MLLARRGVRPRKRLGQHFLVDRGAARRIAQLCTTEQSPAELIEIGPGTGALTRELVAQGPKVVAIEIDEHMVQILRDQRSLQAATIVHADALGYDYDKLTAGSAWVAAGNLPYNIATPLILSWLELRNPPARIVAMVQRDVAERFVAAPSTPAYGSLTVAIKFSMKVQRAFVLGQGSFYPRPNVESAVVTMDRLAQPPVDPGDRTFFLKVVRAAFAYRRKTLANSLALALGIPREETEAALSRIGHAAQTRGEQLDLDDFAALARQLAA